MIKKIEDRYLGDGVYASFDGFNIILDLRGQDNTTRIALEPQVLGMLMIYEQEIAELRKQKAGESK